MSAPARRSQPIRVVHVIQNLNYGGMERVLHSLARQLPTQGFDVHIVVFEYLGHFAAGLEGQATFHRMRPMSRLSLIHPGSLITLFRRLDPDIVHSHAGAWIQASRAAHVANVPVMVHTEHGRPSPVPLADRLIDNCASRWTDAVIAVSTPLAEVLRREVVREPNRVRVITNGVDIDCLRPVADRNALRAEIGLPQDALIIGSIGRLEPVKNYQLAIRALALLAERADGGPPPTLVIAGDGSERTALEALAAELGVAARVKFLGWRNDAERLYGAFDIFTLPSRSEGTSISLLEAMSSGVCPIVTDVGGNRAVLGQGLELLLVRDNDAPGLASGWQRMIENPNLRAEHGTHARARVKSTFSLTQMVDAHVALYHSLLGDSKPDQRGQQQRRWTGR